MKRFVSVLKALPKRLMAAVAVVTAVAVASSSVTAAAIRLEGSLGVANVTAGDTKYAQSVNAKYDEVVKIQVYYHNREAAGSNKVANNLRVKLAFPTTASAKQVVNGTISADNANTINDSVAVNLNRADAQLEYIPGSAVWKHNKGTDAKVQIVEEKISDAVVTGAQGLVLENAKPCYNFDATVTVLARVKVPSISITKKVRPVGDGQAVTQLAAKPSQRLEYLVTLKNLGNTNLSNVYVRDPLPKGLTFVPGTAKKFYGQYNGTVMSADEANAFFNSKKNIGTLLPGATAFITFEATVSDVKTLACGDTSIKNIAVVDTDQTGEYNNSATVTTNKVCEEQPQSKAPVCTDLTLKKVGGRKIEATVIYKENDAKLKNITYNFGEEGKQPLVTDKTTVPYEYAKDGEYTVTTTLRFTDSKGAEVVVTNEKCADTVTFTTPEKPQTPEELPHTGAGDVLAIAAVVAVAGALAHRLVWARRS